MADGIEINGNIYSPSYAEAINEKATIEYMNNKILSIINDEGITGILVVYGTYAGIIVITGTNSTNIILQKCETAILLLTQDGGTILHITNDNTIETIQINETIIKITGAFKCDTIYIH